MVRGHEHQMSAGKWMLSKRLNDGLLTRAETSSGGWSVNSDMLCFEWLAHIPYIHRSLGFASSSPCHCSGLPLSSSSTCPCLNESRGALFLAPCHHPRGPCLLLLYFWDTHCMTGSQWPPHSLPTHHHVALHLFMAVTCAGGELGNSWDRPQKCTTGLSPSLSVVHTVCTYEDNWCVAARQSATVTNLLI